MVVGKLLCGIFHIAIPVGKVVELCSDFKMPPFPPHLFCPPNSIPTQMRKGKGNGGFRGLPGLAVAPVVTVQAQVKGRGEPTAE